MASSLTFYDTRRFIEPVPPEFTCGICYNVPAQPRLCMKEHVFCLTCITDWLEKKEQCPVCEDHLTMTKLRPLGRLLLNMYNRMELACGYADQGCQEHPAIEQLKSHMESCPFKKAALGAGGASGTVGVSGNSFANRNALRLPRYLRSSFSSESLQNSGRNHVVDDWAVSKHAGAGGSASPDREISSGNVFGGGSGAGGFGGGGGGSGFETDVLTTRTTSLMSQSSSSSSSPRGTAVVSPTLKGIPEISFMGLVAVTPPLSFRSNEDQKNPPTVFDLITANDTDGLYELLSSNPDLVHAADTQCYYCSPLFFAAHLGNMNAVAVLLQHGAMPSEIGWDTAHAAALLGELPEPDSGGVTAKVDAMENPPHWQQQLMRWSGTVPLFQAVYNGQYSTAAALLSQTPRSMLLDDDGLNVLHYACLGGHNTMVELVYSELPDLLAHTTPEGLNALHCAADGGNSSLMDWIESHCPNMVDAKSALGHTVAHYAAWSGCVSVLEWILDRLPELFSVKSRAGQTPMHCACEGGHLSAVEWLHSQFPTMMDIKDNTNHTVFHSAASGRGGRTTDVLSWIHNKTPFMVDITTVDGHTSMHSAAWMGNVTAMKWIHRIRPRLFRTGDRVQWTPFHSAAKGGSIKAMEFIFNLDQSTIDAKDKDGWSVLAAAAMGGSLDAMKWILNKRPKMMDDSTVVGRTLMHCAAAGGNLEICQWVHRERPDMITKKSIDGRTVLQIAKSRNYSDIVDWISENRLGVC